MTVSRTGKIARCPLHIREEVNQRLLNGESGPKIIKWLNAHEDVLKVLDEYFGEEPINNDNLSQWRKGGYDEWLKRRAAIDETKSLAKFAADIAKAAGGNLTDGAAAILGGRILEAIEAGGPITNKPEDGAEVVGFDLEGMTKALVALRSTDLEHRKAGQRERLLSQKEREVTLKEKVFQTRTCELFLKWYDDEQARRIVEGKAKSSVKIEQLRLAMFGPIEETPDVEETDSKE